MRLLPESIPARIDPNQHVKAQCKFLALAPSLMSSGKADVEGAEA